MKAAVYYSNNDVRIEEYDIPEVGEGEILVKSKSCGVCVADTVECYLTERAPQVLGHGDRVFVHHHVTCMSCGYCRSFQGSFMRMEL